MDKLSSFLNSRPVFATLIVGPAVYFYWESLLESLEGSVFKATMIVAFFWFGIAADVQKNMVGQPGGDDDHHHHD